MCMIHISGHSSERYKVLSCFGEKYSAKQTTSNSEDINSNKSNIYLKELKIMVKIAVSTIIKYLKDKNECFDKGKKRIYGRKESSLNSKNGACGIDRLNLEAMGNDWDSDS